MTMTLNRDVEELLTGGDGYLAVSPLTTTFPTDINDCIPDPDTLEVDLDADWLDLGYLTEQGPQMTFSRNIKDIKAWQSFYELDSITTDVPTQVEFALRQWNGDNFGIGVGGVVIESTTNGVIVTPESPSFKDIRQLLLYATDGEKHYAWGFRRVRNTKELQFPFTREDEAALPIGFKVLGPPAGEADAWFMLTDDPNFTPTGS